MGPLCLQYRLPRNISRREEETKVMTNALRVNACRVFKFFEPEYLYFWSPFLFRLSIPFARGANIGTNKQKNVTALIISDFDPYRSGIVPKVRLNCKF